MWSMLKYQQIQPFKMMFRSCKVVTFFPVFSSHYIQTFFIIALMFSVAVGTYRFCVDNESTLSKVGFVGIALICECVLFRYVLSYIVVPSCKVFSAISRFLGLISCQKFRQWKTVSFMPTMDLGTRDLTGKGAVYLYIHVLSYEFLFKST